MTTKRAAEIRVQDRVYFNDEWVHPVEIKRRGMFVVGVMGNGYETVWECDDQVEVKVANSDQGETQS